jgi:ribonuclease HII
MIDRINIRRATLAGVLRVYRRLARASARGDAAMPDHVMLDGGLFLPRGIPQETIIRGDEKVPVIAAASIIAKVTRDRLMRRLHKKYPEYRFDLHKGYGTALHREMIRRHGMSDIHRRSFRII